LLRNNVERWVATKRWWAWHGCNHGANNIGCVALIFHRRFQWDVRLNWRH